MFTFNLSRWLKSLFRRRVRPIERKPRFRLQFEQLEDRITPIAYTWTGGSGNWGSAANWGGTAINTAQPIELNFPLSGITATNDLVGLKVDQITFGQNNITLAGNPFTLGFAGAGSGFITVQAGFTDSISAGMNIALGNGSAANQQFIDVGSGSKLTINSVMTGAVGAQVSKQGLGTLVLAGTNTFTGPFVISNNSGTVQAANAQAFGAAGNTVTVSFSSQLQLTGGFSFANYTVQLFGNGAANDGALYNLAGANTWTGSVVLESGVSNNSAINVFAGSLTISGIISDAGGNVSLTKLGASNLILTNSNIYRGATYIENGVLTIQNPLALGAVGTAGTYTQHNSVNGDQGSLQLGFVAPVFPAVPVNSQYYILKDPALAYSAANPYVGFVVPNYSLFLLGQGFGGGFTLDNASGANAWSGPVVLQTDPAHGINAVNINVAAAGAVQTQLLITGVISDQDPLNPATLNKANLGQGNLVLEPTIHTASVDLGNTYRLATLPGGFQSLVQFGGTGTANTYLGSTNIGFVAGGTVTIVDSQGLGPTNKIKMNSVGQGSSLNLVSNVGHIDSVTATTNRLLVDAPLTLNGPGWNIAGKDTGTIHSISGINTYGPNAAYIAANPATPDIITVSIFAGSIGVEREPVETANANYFANDYSLTITGGIACSNFFVITLTKVDAGHLILPTANVNFGGLIDIKSGWITIEDPQAFGPQPNGVQELWPTEIVESGAALMFKPFQAGTSFDFFMNLKVQGMGISHPFGLINQKGAIENLGGVNSISGNITFIGQTGVGVEQVDPTITSELSLTGNELYQAAPPASFTLPTIAAADGVTQYAQIIDTGSVSGTISIAYTGMSNNDFKVYYGPRGTPGSTLLTPANFKLNGAGVYPITGLSYSGGGTNLEIVIDDGLLGGSATWTYTVTVTPDLTGTNVKGGIVKVGSQRLIVQAPGSYSGGVDIKEGVVRVANNAGLGSQSNNLGVTVETGAALELATLPTLTNGGVSGGTNLWGIPLTLYGTGNSAFGDAPLTVLSADHQWQGPITLNSNIAITFQGALANTPVGALTAIYRDATGALTLTGTSPTIDAAMTTTGVAAIGGNIPVSAVQTLTFGGSITDMAPHTAYFKLRYNGVPTGNILWSSDPNVLVANILAGLNGIAALNGKVAVSLTSPTINVAPNARFVSTGVISDGGGLVSSNPLIHNYVLSGAGASYNDTLGGSALVNQGGALTAAGYTWVAAPGGPAVNQGLTLSNWVTGAPSASGNYSIQIDFTFTAVPSINYLRLIDFKNSVSDNGFYFRSVANTVANTALDFYSGGPFDGPTGVYHTGAPSMDLVITRDGASGQVTAFLDGVQQFSFPDALNDGVFSGPNNIMKFFIDDGFVSDEISGGTTTAIKVYNRPLTPAEVLTVFSGGTLGGASGTALAPSDLNLSGGGEIVLAGANTYRGTTFVNQSTLTIQDDAAHHGQALGASTYTFLDSQAIPVAHAVQELAMTNFVAGASAATATTFQLYYDPAGNPNAVGVNITAPIVYTGTSADAPAIQTALQGLTTIGGGNVRVTQQNPGVFLITFYNGLSATTTLVKASVAGGVIVNGTSIINGLAGGTVVANNAQLQMEGGIVVGGEPLIIQGSGTNLESTVQNFTIGTVTGPPNPASGSFQLNLTDGVTQASTVAIPFNANAIQVQTALQTMVNAIPSYAGGKVTVLETASSAGTNEEQQFVFPAGYNGQYQLYFDPAGGAPVLNYNLTPAINFTGVAGTDRVNAVAALNKLQTVSAAAIGGTVLGGGSGISPTERFSVFFTGGLGNQPLPLVVVSYPGAHTGNITVSHAPIGTTATRTFTAIFTGVLAGQLVPKMTSSTPTLNAALGAAPVGTLPLNVTQYYVVTAITPQGEFISNEQSVTPLVAGTQTANLTWNAVAGATGYKVYRSTVAGNYTNALLATLGAVTSYDDDNSAAVGPGTPSGNTTATNPGYTTQGGTANNTPFQYFAVGPAPIANAQVFNGAFPSGLPAQATAGRVTGVDTWNGAPQDIVISTAGGGFWITRDNGQHWAQQFDAPTNAPIFAGAVAVTQGAPTRMYFGTGEGDNSGDSYYGTGVWYRSGGALIQLGGAANPLVGKAINKIIIDPNNIFQIWVAVADRAANGTSGNAGVWRYDGNNWLNMTAGFASNNIDYSDIYFDGNNL